MADQDNLELPEDFDRLLRHELSVEPSTSFAARVRQRVSDEERRLPWWRARWIPALGSVGTLASIAFALVLPTIGRWMSSPVAPSPPAVPVAVVEPPKVHSTMALPSASVVSRFSTTRPTSRRVAESDFPVVIVDRRQRAALATLFAMMDQGWVSGDSFAATVPVSMDPIVDHVSAITVTPVVVNAISPGGVLPDKER